MGEIGLIPLVHSRSHNEEGGRLTVAVGTTFIQELEHYLAVTTASGDQIVDFAGLKGKRVGVLSHGSCDSYLLKQMVERDAPAGTLQSITVVPLAERYGLLDVFRTSAPTETSQDTVDAAFLVDPALAHGELSGSVRILGRAGDYFRKYQWGTIFATLAATAKDSDLLIETLDIYRKCVRHIAEALDGKNPGALSILMHQAPKWFDGLQGDVLLTALRRGRSQWALDWRNWSHDGAETCIESLREMGVLGQERIHACDIFHQL
jgi:hypothetical protein